MTFYIIKWPIPIYSNLQRADELSHRDSGYVAHWGRLGCIALYASNIS